MFSELGDLLEEDEDEVSAYICYSMQYGLVEEAMGKAGSQVQRPMQL
jgi:hypothetical protein